MKKLFKVDTDKEAFDIVLEHLLEEQGVRCGDDLGCYYDGSASIYPELAGLRCAVGALMTDEALKELGSFEGGVRSLKVAANDLDFELGNLNEKMLSDLQRIHDEDDSELWRSSLVEIKIKFNL